MIHRELHLLEGAEVNIWDYLIPRDDYYYKGDFFIFGLAPGEYELIFRGQGYKPFFEKCLVREGKLLDPVFIELTPE